MADLSALSDLLERAEQAINAWVATYASDECSEEAVSAAWKLIRDGGGTLFYAATLMSDLRAARDALQADIRKS